MGCLEWRVEDDPIILKETAVESNIVTLPDREWRWIITSGRDTTGG